MVPFKIFAAKVASIPPIGTPCVIVLDTPASFVVVNVTS